VPGHSSDFDAILMAEESGALTVINLSNIDYAYDKDPNKYPDAKKIEKISWSEFRKLLPEKWEPGLSSPFDPIAAKHAQDLGLEVVIMNGSNLENLSNYLDGKNFLGTVISE
jgi:uridylate kinase